MNSEEKERNKRRSNQEAMRSLAMISQFSINMLVPIFLCFFAGFWLDKKLGTSYFIIIFFFLGALAGFRNIYVYAKKRNERDKELETENKSDATRLIEKALEDERKNHSK